MMVTSLDHLAFIVIVIISHYCELGSFKLTVHYSLCKHTEAVYCGWILSFSVCHSHCLSVCQVNQLRWR